MAHPHFAQWIICNLNFEPNGSINVDWNICQSHFGHLGIAMITFFVNIRKTLLVEGLKTLLEKRFNNDE
jgi:hypothetical protein